MKLSALEAALSELVAGHKRPVAVFAALWPVARACRMPPDRVVDTLRDLFLEWSKTRTVLMPTFCGGYVEGLCNLDEEPSTTGLLSERYRSTAGVRRTRSAFFSFAVAGPDCDTLVALAPQEAWGEGSLYAWMYECDVDVLTLGVHPTHCSYSHHAEWLCRDVIPYRYAKTFEGDLIHEAARVPFRETLLVRQRDPAPVNDFTPFLDAYLERGMRIIDLEGIRLSAFGARAKTDVLRRRIANDPLAVIANREDFADA